jgi:hypothetical protein
MKMMKSDRSSQRPLAMVVLALLALAMSGAQAWGGGTLELTVLEEGLRISCLANVITSLGCTQPDLGGTQGCADPKPRTVAGSGAGGAINVRGLNFDFGARRRGAKPGLQLSDLVRRDLQGEVAGALRAQYQGRRAAPSIDGELGTSDFGDSGLLADLFGTTNVGALTFTKLPDASSAALFERTFPSPPYGGPGISHIPAVCRVVRGVRRVRHGDVCVLSCVGRAVSAGRWMNITDYEGADDCYTLPMVYLEFNLPTNSSTSSAYFFHSFSNDTRHTRHDTGHTTPDELTTL